MYRSIGDYGVIGDCHSAALISSDGSIDWACLPHFDSGAQFFRLLDDKKGGYCSVAPAEPALSTRRYIPETNILETTWETSTGALCVTDFMPLGPRQRPESANEPGNDTDTDHRIIRLVTCRREPVSLAVEVRPVLDFGRQETTVHVAEDGIAVVRGADSALHLQLIGRPLLAGRDGRSVNVFRLHPGETAALVITWKKAGEPVTPLSFDDVHAALKATRDYWHDWVKTFSYRGDHRDIVLRSALALKLMSFAPTGAIVAAPTTSLPEAVGSVRNWDYRFTWLRDATFTLIALMNLGYFDEARDFLNFFNRALGERNQFQVLYTICGGLEATEHNLDHLAGYEGSRPVRLGNKASEQKQLDIYGEVIHCLYLYVAHPDTNLDASTFHRNYWNLVQTGADYVCEHWREPDRGIWEMRGDPKNFVYSKGACWLALDRAIKLARFCGETGDVDRWARSRDSLSRNFIHEGFNAQVGAFTQFYGSTALDASVLRLPIFGVIDANDPKMLSTIEAIEERLMRNGLVYRYREDDGLPGQEGAFLACCFWLVDNYVLCGRLKDARELFAHLMTFANDLGLFSEEVDPESGASLGNFPQAFTHIAVINAALRLSAARRGRTTAAHNTLHQDGDLQTEKRAA